MLLSRSASLISSTRMSRAMAMTILRMVSAWAASRVSKPIRSSLVRPSVILATSGPNWASTSARVMEVSSTTSWSSAAMIEVGHDHRHTQRMGDEGKARLPHLAGVLLTGDLVGAADQHQVGPGVAVLHLAEQPLDVGLGWRLRVVGAEQAYREPVGGALGGAVLAVGALSGAELAVNRQPVGDRRPMLLRHRPTHAFLTPRIAVTRGNPTMRSPTYPTSCRDRCKWPRQYEQKRRPLVWSGPESAGHGHAVRAAPATAGGRGAAPVHDRRSLVPDQAEELVALDQFASTEEAELDQGGDADHLAAEPLHQAGRGARGPAGGQYVVDDQHALARRDRVRVDLEGGGPVLEAVLLRLHGGGQFAGLADGHEAGSEVVGDRRGQDEPPGLDAEHAVDVAASEVDDRLIDHRREGDLVRQQRGDVLEDDALLREIRDVTDQGAEAVGIDWHGSSISFSDGAASPSVMAAGRRTCGVAGLDVASVAGVGRGRRPAPAPRPPRSPRRLQDAGRWGCPLRARALPQPVDGRRRPCGGARPLPPEPPPTCATRARRPDRRAPASPRRRRRPRAWPRGRSAGGCAARSPSRGPGTAWR